ncbi:MAG: hypothetical protein ABFS23_02410 [Pseudomonadota bacterium]
MNIRSMLTLGVVFGLFSGGPIVAEEAAERAMPAGIVAGMSSLTATVEAVDKTTRVVTLKGPEGNTVDITAGDEVRNFDQIDVGDKVVVEYYEGLALALQEGEWGIREKRESVDVSRAEPGEKPAGQVTKTVDAIATVEAVDKEKRLVQLKGAERNVTLKVDDKVVLDQIEVGDEVKATYIESVAISVVEPDAK